MLRLKSLKEPTNHEDGLIGRDIYQKIIRVGINGGKIWLQAKCSLKNLLKTRP